MTLEEMREEVARAVAIFQERGDANIHYVNGLDLFGAAYADNLPDQLHPDGDGYIKLGNNFVTEVFTKLGIRVGRAGVA
ncbi:MAG: hypothetical protein BWY76_02109 [bacterium ADurb.Bin429]|nr:MAG: hypothetical protein BWY76_02109 [bacterium ADurb.Bin429]